MDLRKKDFAHMGEFGDALFNKLEQERAAAEQEAQKRAAERAALKEEVYAAAARAKEKAKAGEGMPLLERLLGVPIARQIIAEKTLTREEMLERLSEKMLLKPDMIEELREEILARVERVPEPVEPVQMRAELDSLGLKWKDFLAGRRQQFVQKVMPHKPEHILWMLFEKAKENPAAVAEALDELEKEGIIRRRQPKRKPLMVVTRRGAKILKKRT